MYMVPARFSLDPGPHTFGGYEGFVQSSTVSGIELPGAEPLTYDGHQPVGETVTREIGLPEHIAQRIGSFFLHRYSDASRTHNDAGADCHSFIGYALGTAKAVAPASEDTPFIPAELESFPTPVSSMQPYTPYGLIDLGTGENVHSVISLPDGENISVRGMRAPLVIADTAHMLSEFGAQAVHRIIRPPIY